MQIRPNRINLSRLGLDERVSLVVKNRGEGVENELSMVGGDLKGVGKGGIVNTGMGNEFLPELGERLNRVREDELGDWEESVLERLPTRMNKGIGIRVGDWIGLAGRRGWWLSRVRHESEKGKAFFERKMRAFCFCRSLGNDEGRFCEREKGEECEGIISCGWLHGIDYVVVFWLGTLTEHSKSASDTFEISYNCGQKVDYNSNLVNIIHHYI